MTYQEFMNLIQQADKETSHWSHPVTTENCPPLREIVDAAQGDADILAYTCLILKDHVHLALAILYKIVPEEQRPPIPDYYRGRIPVIRACWQYWALKEKHVSTKFDPHAYWVEDKYGNRAEWH